ncbi:hypothetical protein B0H17DRAFT_1217923 [Mycena rosella]|uniref:Uncharacterized protein n=1 Tax=Mycena rosella TaxID=1033263 RepID=A0AAD7FP96_MYCRO|nr:hypothetical protein B0H17DRAFT_1217923 [Mycena rosella]
MSLEPPAPNISWDEVVEELEDKPWARPACKLMMDKVLQAAASKVLVFRILNTREEINRLNIEI